MSKILNLVDRDKSVIEYELFKFGSGEPHITIRPLTIPESVTIFSCLRNAYDVMVLLVATNALRQMHTVVNDITLRAPYIPGGRQDRVDIPGTALTIEVYTNLINAQGYKEVVIFDPHSNVTTAKLQRVTVRNNHQLVRKVLNSHFSPWKEPSGNSTPIVLISPDAGSNKKIYELSRALGGVPVIRADKKRDPATGNLCGTTVFGDVTGKCCIIVDDICAKGGTFIQLAKELKSANAAEIHLIVSHYEGTADMALLYDAGISSVHTTDSLGSIKTQFRMATPLGEARSFYNEYSVLEFL